MDNKELAQKLAYMPIMSKYVQRKYEISASQMSVLLFIYHKRTFPLRQYFNYKCMFKWEAKAFHEMQRRGFMKIAKESSKKLGVIYASTRKTDKIVEEFFEMLRDDVFISTDPEVNPLFKREDFQDKVFSNFMKAINRERERRPVPGLYDTDDSEF